MRKLKIVIVTSLLCIFLSACSEFELDSVLKLFQSQEEAETVESKEAIAEVADKGESESKEETSPKEASGPPAMEVYKKALAAAEEIDSLQIDFEMDQQANVDGMDMHVVTDVIVQANYDPLVMHQDGVFVIDMGKGNTYEMDFEAYITEDDMYYYLGMLGQWINVNGPMAELMDDAIEVDVFPSPYDQLTLFEKSLDKVTLSNSGNEYILSIDADMSTYKDIYRELLKPYGQDSLDEWIERGEFLVDADIEKFIIDMYIDKETFMTTHFEMNMLFHFVDDGAIFSIEQTIKGEYSKINEIGTIEIPEEVKEGMF